jgi:hypothetical protein
VNVKIPLVLQHGWASELSIGIVCIRFDLFLDKFSLDDGCCR